MIRTKKKNIDKNEKEIIEIITYTLKFIGISRFIPQTTLDILDNFTEIGKPEDYQNKYINFVHSPNKKCRLKPIVILIYLVLKIERKIIEIFI